MKTALHPLPVVIIFLGAFVLACGGLGGSVPPAQVAPPSPVYVDTPVPVPPIPTYTVTPTQQVFAPACAPCPAPVIEDTQANDTYCTKKMPYQNISLEPGAVFEPLDPSGELKCFDTGKVREVDGRKLKIWSCTGRQLWTYDLKITSSSCHLNMNLKLDSAHCPAGLMYSAAQNCCAPLIGGENIPVIIKVNMGACK